MKWTQEHIGSIRHLFPKQRGNVEIDYLRFFQALHYIDKNGCTWRDLPEKYGKDKAYEGDACRAKAKQCGMRPVVPPKSNRKKPWRYDKKLYEGRNVVERNFRNIKQFRRVFTRYDKLDETYNAFISIAYVCIHLKN